MKFADLEEVVKMKLPEWIKMVAMHGVSGFLIGFSAAFVAGGKPEIPELQTAIYTACVGGLYGALKAVAAYLETMLKPAVPAAQLKRAVVAGQEPTTWTKDMI